MNMSSKMWILGRPWRDSLFILFPGVIGLVFSFTFWKGSIQAAIYAFLAMIVIDSGHVYITFWRTLFRKEERSTHPTYWMTPLGTFIIAFLWLILEIPYFWSFVVYATVYHHMRQFYGISRWYQKLNVRFCSTTNRFLYALMIVPFILLHFRSIKELEYYTSTDILFYPSKVLFTVGVITYLMIWIAWVIFEIKNAKGRPAEWNRILSVVAPAVVYGVCGIFGRNSFEIVLPLLFAHGIPYFALMDISLKRLDPAKFKKTIVGVGLLLFTAILFAGIEYFVEETFIEVVPDNYALYGMPVGQAIIIALFITPLFCHYIWDAHIWRGKHRESKIVFEPFSE